MNKTNLIIKQNIDITVCNYIDLSTLNAVLKNVSPLYPNFETWLNFTFRRNIANGERSILLANDGTNILGIALLKHTPQENKICTFYIPEEFRGMEIGNGLMSESLSILGNNTSTITVADERLNELKPILKSHKFELTDSTTSLYRSGVTEHIFTL